MAEEYYGLSSVLLNDGTCGDRDRVNLYFDALMKLSQDKSLSSLFLQVCGVVQTGSCPGVDLDLPDDFQSLRLPNANGILEMARLCLRFENPGMLAAFLGRKPVVTIVQPYSDDAPTRCLDLDLPAEVHLYSGAFRFNPKVLSL